MNGYIGSINNKLEYNESNHLLSTNKIVMCTIKQVRRVNISVSPIDLSYVSMDTGIQINIKLNIYFKFSL